MKRTVSVVIKSIAIVLFVTIRMHAQTNPAAQSLPYVQNFGTTTFTTLPAGIAVWNGISGGATSTQSLAEASVPLGNATIVAATAIQVSGGAYGYASGGNAQVYIQTSGNAANGVNQLALAINTTDIQNVKVSYKITMLFTQIRSVGVVLQYRVGTSGAWTSVDGTSYYHNNSDRVSGAEDIYTDLFLPVNAGNQPVVQLRWAIWRGIENATSSGIGIDDISVSSAGNGIVVPNPKLFSLNFVTSDKMNIAWESPTFGDDSVLVFAREDSSIEYKPNLIGRAYTNASSNFSTAGVYGNSKLVYNGTENSVTISSLSENKKYYFKAYAYRDTGISAGTPIIFDTAEVQGVSNITAISANQQVKLLWKNYAGPQGIFWDEVMVVGKAASTVDAVPTGSGSLYSANSIFGSGTQIGTGNFAVYKGISDTITISGLTNITTYAFKIFVRNGASWSAGWRSVSANAIPSDGPIVPPAPVLSAPADGAASVLITPQLFWNASLGAASYRVQLSSSPEFSTLIVNDSTVQSTSVVVKPLQVETKYYWRVSASNSAGASDFSSVFSFTTASAYLVPQQIIFSGESGTTLIANIVTSYKPSTTQGYPPPALFGEAYKLPNGNVRCVYTGLETAGGSGMNIEHTFPQSKGAGSGLARSDMNHLFPTQIGVNSDRANYPFGNIPENEVSYWYRLTTKTPSKPTSLLDEYSRVKSGVIFETRADHKGNVARAMFYFYTMYKSQADAADPNFFNPQKNVLYQWHYLDPVDSLEYVRAQIIAKYQSNKANPFILDTTLIRRAYFPQITVSVTKQPIVPLTTNLEQNYPNPFNPTTVINYGLPKAGNVVLKVYDILGKEVATLVNNHQEPGRHSVEFNAAQFSSGIYIYKLTSEKFSDVKKMILLR